MKQRIATAAILVLLGVIAALRIQSTYSELSATFDEGYHTASALQIYQQGQFNIGAEQPPLARWVIGLLPNWAGVEYRDVRQRVRRPAAMIVALATSVFEEQGEYWKTLALARSGNLVFLPVLLFYSYRWAAALYGETAGRVAATLVTFSPSVLAHASVATVDFAVTACLVMAGYYWWRWLRDPTPRAAIIAGVTSGLAVASKYSAIGFLPVVLAAFAMCHLGVQAMRPRSWAGPETRKAAQSLVLASCIAVLTLWATFGFEMRPLRDPSRRPYETLERALPHDGIPKACIQWAIENIPLPLRDAAIGLSWVSAHTRSGHPSYLLGQVSSSGWWYYFPVVLAVKTTLPLLGLVGLAGWIAWRRPSLGGREALGPLLAALGMLLLVLPSRVNIGVRHILVIYPFLAIWASSCFRQGFFTGSRPLAVAAFVLVGWHGVESWQAHPDYLPYFNQIARGREHLVLGDSNLDWGQDLHRLARYVKSNGIENLSLSYFGATSPEAMGLHDYEEFGPRERPRGWVAVSVTKWQGIYEPRPAWLDGYKPRMLIGKSIWLYFIE